MIIEKAPDDQRPYPLTKSAPRGLGAAGFLSHAAALSAASGYCFVLDGRLGKLERRERTDQLGMHSPDVVIGVAQELLLVFSPEDVTAIAAVDA
jgi:hypothetical protein